MSERRALPEALLDPAAYPYDVEHVKLIETHISWVFIAGGRVFKVKKPVDFGFLDYSTLALRKKHCEEEVRLNQRLCSSAYIGVSPITQTDEGLQIDGEGSPVEFAVQMHRLPSERMLDHLLREGLVRESTIERIAQRIGEFHQHADRSPTIAEYGDISAIERNWQENFDQIDPYVPATISRAHLRRIRRYVQAILSDQAEVFNRRVADGFIRDCHGDMRAESICVTDTLCIFDCIEFSERIRCGDTASEMAFLAMDLDARGRPDLAYWLIDRYVDATGDSGLRDVLLFYACYRAFVRGKVQSFRLDQPVRHESEHRTARARAAHYLNLAWEYTRAPQGPCLVLVCGLPGTGKTTVARALAFRLNADVHSSDRVRKSLAGVSPTDRPGDLIYDETMTRHTYDRLIDLADSSLQNGRSVVLDATYRQESERAAVRALAQSRRIPFAIVECRSSEELVLERIDQRTASGEGASDADRAIYLALRESFEPAPETHRKEWLAVETSLTVSQIVRKVFGPIVRMEVPEPAT